LRKLHNPATDDLPQHPFTVPLHERPQVTEIPTTRQQHDRARRRAIERAPVERRRMHNSAYADAELGEQRELAEPDERIARVVVEGRAHQHDVTYTDECVTQSCDRLDP